MRHAFDAPSPRGHFCHRPRKKPGGSPTGGGPGVGPGVGSGGPPVDPVEAKFKIQGEHQEVIHAPELLETVLQQVIIGPGGSTGWHSHPGPVVVLIKAGELTFYSSEDPTCTPRTYSAGEAFIDQGQGHVHLARNLSGQNVELWATYFDVPVGGAIRLDAPNPGNCGF